MRQWIRWRVSPQWYLLALCGMPLAIIIAASVWHGAAPFRGLAAHWPQYFTALLPKALLIALLVSLWEETGWTGFLLTRLETRFGVLPAVLLTNTCQALVHVPLLFIAGGLSDGPRIPVSQYPTYLVYLFVFALGIRIMMTWLYHGSGGSLLIVALFHAMWNVTASADFLLPFVPGGTGSLAYGTLAVCALLVVVFTRGRLGYGRARPNTRQT
jgi:membrane protease YdiL (CAAX protease family)